MLAADWFGGGGSMTRKPHRLAIVSIGGSTNDDDDEEACELFSPAPESSFVCVVNFSKTEWPKN